MKFGLINHYFSKTKIYVSCKYSSTVLFLQVVRPTLLKMSKNNKVDDTDVPSWLKEELIHTSIRFGLGRFNTEEEIDYTVRRMTEIVSRLRDHSPIYKKERPAKVEKR